MLMEGLQVRLSHLFNTIILFLLETIQPHINLFWI